MGTLMHYFTKAPADLWSSKEVNRYMQGSFGVSECSKAMQQCTDRKVRGVSWGRGRGSEGLPGNIWLLEVLWEPISGNLGQFWMMNLGEDWNLLAGTELPQFPLYFYFKPWWYMWHWDMWHWDVWHYNMVTVWQSMVRFHSLISSVQVDQVRSNHRRSVEQHAVVADVVEILDLQHFRIELDSYPTEQELKPRKEWRVV